jgi:alpha-amylase
MGVALIAWGRFFDQQGNHITVPAPSTDAHAPWLWDFMAREASDLGRIGFTALQLPPASKAQGGAGRGCDGYGVFDPRDLGTKPQQGSTPTRYGTGESLRRLVAAAHTADLDVYLDVVLHQLSGENGGPGRVTYLGADGRTLNGRGAMHPGCFRGVPPANRPDDEVPVPADDTQFGREKVYQHCQPPRYTIDDALDYGDWLLRTTAADGMRFDDTKGTWAPFVSEFLHSRTMAGKFAYSEYFDGNPANLDWWATSAPMSSRSLVLDFTLHFALKAACENGDPSGLDGAGYTAWNPWLSCTFVDSPDTDLQAGQAIIAQKLLAYAYILTIEGYPFVFGKDYFPGSVWPGAYGLKPFIDNLVWIHEHLASGATATRWLDRDCMVINRLGGPGLLTALHFSAAGPRTLTVQTAFGANCHLHDYTGRHGDIWTDGQGRATFTLPGNERRDGQAYLCFSRDGAGAGRARPRRTTTQTFFGAHDLDLGPVEGGTATSGRIWCAKGTAITLRLNLHLAAAQWTAQTRVTAAVVGPGAAALGTHTWSQATHGATEALHATAASSGWHELRLTGAGLPAAGIPYELTATYTAAGEIP